MEFYLDVPYLFCGGLDGDGHIFLGLFLSFTDVYV